MNLWLKQYVEPPVFTFYRCFVLFVASLGFLKKQFFLNSSETTTLGSQDFDREIRLCPKLFGRKRTDMAISSILLQAY